MRVLIINKFLHPNGGSETYIFGLGNHLSSLGHQVEYFGMEHPDRVVGNSVEAYTSNMDFHSGSKLSKIFYPVKTIYSTEARKKLHMVLENFRPDVCHINNFNFQLTPSIILEIVNWRKKNSHPCKIVLTAHDLQLVCPNHMCYNPNTNQVCEKCLDGSVFNCTSGKCIHGSTAKSLVGTMESVFWKINGAYKYIDKIICCSNFLKSKLDTNPLFAQKTVALHNFINISAEDTSADKRDYVLYFGRYSREKGINTLISACKALPDINFIFAGSGPLEGELLNIPNITNVGFQTGEALYKLIRQARFTVCPSEVYENCPFSVMESQVLHTPVLGAEIGGIPELIIPGETGEFFESFNLQDLIEKIQYMWKETAQTPNKYTDCSGSRFDTISEYVEKLIKYYI